MAANRAPNPNLGTITTFVGMSGSGKTTQMGLLATHESVRLSTNTTTRAPRPTDAAHEYHYLDMPEYETAKARGRFLWDVVTGNGARYSKDLCDIIEAFTDPDHLYVQALIPECALWLVNRYGPEQVRTIWLPNPGQSALQDRMVGRGDSLASAALRFSNEQSWYHQTMAIPNIYVVGAMTVEAQQTEIANYLGVD